MFAGSIGRTDLPGGDYDTLISSIKEKLLHLDEKTMVCRLDPKILDDMLHPVVDPEEEKTAVRVAEGLPAGPGGAWGVDDPGRCAPHDDEGRGAHDGSYDGGHQGSGEACLRGHA